MDNRKSYKVSCELLQNCGLIDEGPIPPLPDNMPSFEDPEPLGISFFKELIEDGNLDNLTLPRTFIGRSKVTQVSFKDTNLTESRLCWNDFIEVDFTQCNLAGCDLSASLFYDVMFVHAQLSNSDLRHSSFTRCDFTDAKLKGAKLTATQAAQLNLLSEQEIEIDWQSEEGEEPGGG